MDKIIKQLNEQGLTLALSADGKNLAVSGPLTDDLRRVIRLHKPALLKALFFNPSVVAPLARWLSADTARAALEAWQSEGYPVAAWPLALRRNGQAIQFNTPGDLLAATINPSPDLMSYAYVWAGRFSQADIEAMNDSPTGH